MRITFGDLLMGKGGFGQLKKEGRHQAWPASSLARLTIIHIRNPPTSAARLHEAHEGHWPCEGNGLTTTETPLSHILLIEGKQIALASSQAPGHKSWLAS